MAGASMFTAKRGQLAVAIFAFVTGAGPVCAANWVVLDEKEMMPVCYDRDSIFRDDRGYSHFNWRFKHKSCTDDMSVSTQVEAAVNCTQNLTGDFKGYLRVRTVDEKFYDETFERGTARWRLARAICGK
jgi:hypothetical protein